MAAHSQSLALAVEQSLAQGLVLRNRLQYLFVHRDVADRPLTEPRAAQAEHVATATQQNNSNNRH